MKHAIENLKTQPLSLLDELMLMLLNDQNGYFHQIPGWALNCTVTGAAIAELSFQSRIDTDMEALLIVDSTETGVPALDHLLKEIVNEPVQHNAQYWIERLVVHAESLIDSTLDHLVDIGILEHHDGEFWTLATGKSQEGMYGASQEINSSQFIKYRIRGAIFADEIPDPRDVIIICLIQTCDVFRFIFELDDNAEERIKLICKMDLIARSLADAVEQNIANPMMGRSHLTKQIPKISLPRLLRNRNFRKGNVPAVLGDLAKEYGPVFMARLPFAKPMIFLAGSEANRWVHRHGRIHLRSRDYFADFEKVYGASGVLPSLDGSDHFRLRRALSSAYSRKRLETQLDQVYQQARAYMADWRVGESYPATSFCRRMINAQISPLSISVDSQDLFEDLSIYKERALNTQIAKILPKFMLKTPGMKRRAAVVDTLLQRVQSVYTSAQRVDCPRNLADDLLSLHGSDPQLMPESNLRFHLSAALIASVYLGDCFSFALYAMASQPELSRNIQGESDALFANGDPEGGDFTPAKIDITHRFLMECLRMYPIVPMSMRTVINTCVVSGYELPAGTTINIAQTASHYMDEIFTNPFQFDIDRYLPPRNEHRGPGYAPYGLGTHMCLGSKWMMLQLAVNVMIVAHYFTLSVSPTNYVLRFSPLPSMKPNKKLKFHIAEQRHELPI